MSNTEQEIRRVEHAIKITKSRLLKRDYEKYLRKLYKKRARGE